VPQPPMGPPSNSASVRHFTPATRIDLTRAA
jgi:hypothetical protein